MRWWWRNHSVGGTSWNQRRRVAPYCGGATAEGTLTEGSPLKRRSTSPASVAARSSARGAARRRRSTTDAVRGRRRTSGLRAAAPSP